MYMVFRKVNLLLEGTPFLYSARKPEAALYEIFLMRYLAGVDALVQEILVEMMNVFVDEVSCGKTKGNNKKMSFIFSNSLSDCYQVSSPVHMVFRNFAKKWAFQLTPDRRSTVFTVSNLGYASTEKELAITGAT